MPVAIHGETRQQQNRDRVARKAFGQALGCLFTRHLADRERVVANDGIGNQAHIGLGGPGLLILPGVAQEIPVLPPAVESFNPVIGPELFNASFCAH